MLRQNPNPHIRVFAIWEPILPTDYARPGTAVLARLSDTRVAQYWDKDHLFAGQLGRKLESDASHPQPKCCTQRGIQWDEVAVYGSDARWDGELPRAVFLNGPVVRAGDFAGAVTALLTSTDHVGTGARISESTRE